MPENWQLLYFGEACATLVDYTMTRELNTLLAAAVLTSSVFRDMKFLQMPTDSQSSQKLRNANISVHNVYAQSYAAQGTIEAIHSKGLKSPPTRKERQKVHVHKTNAKPTHKNSDEKITQSKYAIE